MDSLDKGTIQILLKIAKFCGTFPSEKPSRLFFCYQFLIFIMNLLWSSWSIYNVVNEFYFDKTSMDIFIDLLTSFFMLFQGSSIQLISLWCPAGWRNLYEELKIDGCKTSGKFSIYLEIVVVHIYYFAKFAFVCWTWVPLVGFHICKNYAFRNVNEYYSLISTMVLVHVNIIIRRRFLLMNQILKNSNCVRHVQMSYRKATQLIDNFNCVFGYQILFIMGHAIVVMLESLYNVLRFYDNVMITSWSIIYSLTVIVLHTQLKAFCCF